MALVCVPPTAVTNPHSVLPVSAEPSLGTLSTVLPTTTSSEEITSSRSLKKITPIKKVPIKY
jgi:hypothetical protein